MQEGYTWKESQTTQLEQLEPSVSGKWHFAGPSTLGGYVVPGRKNYPLFHLDIPIHVQPASRATHFAKWRGRELCRDNYPPRNFARVEHAASAKLRLFSTYSTTVRDVGYSAMRNSRVKSFVVLRVSLQEYTTVLVDFLRNRETRFVRHLNFFIRSYFFIL